MEATFFVPVLLLSALVLYKVWGIIVTIRKQKERRL